MQDNSVCRLRNKFCLVQVQLTSSPPLEKASFMSICKLISISLYSTYICTTLASLLAPISVWFPHS